MKKAIIIASVVLIALIIIFTLISNLFKSTSQSTQALITPEPLNDFASASGLAPTLTTSEKNQALDQFKNADWQGLSPDQKEILEKLKTNLPISTDDYEMSYSADLNHFVVSIKTPQGYDKLKEFLKAKNLLDVYESGSNVFIVGEQPGNAIVSETKQMLIHPENYGDSDVKTEDSTSAQDNPTSGVSKVNKDVKLLTDLLNILYNFNIDIDNNEPTPSTTPNETPSVKGNLLTSLPIDDVSITGFNQTPHGFTRPYPGEKKGHGVFLLGGRGNFGIGGLKGLGEAVDLHASVGTPIKAPFEGRIVGRTDRFGQVLALQSSNKRFAAILAHLRNVLPVGTHVVAGQKVGEVGPMTVAHPHLHFELWKDGQSVNDGAQANARKIWAKIKAVLLGSN